MNKGRKTILIAEDEADLREMYAMSLRNGGFNVIAAEDGKVALEEIKKLNSKVDLIILDIIMPRLDGFDTLGKIRKNPELKKVPIIMSTNLTQEDNKKEALRLGADGYFVKSDSTPKKLLEVAKRILGGEGEKIG